MRTLQRNKQGMKYALLIDEVPIYERDEGGNVKYIDVDGEQVPVETGETELRYGKPVCFIGNISMSGGESKAVEYGIDMSAYDAVLIMQKNEILLTETSLIWLESEVGYKDTAKTIVDGNTADFKVKKVSPSLNQTKYLLERIVK